VQTLYFGGGTPSLLTLSQIEAIISRVRAVFELDLEEVTFEMNPDDVNADFLSGLKDCGITRASMGIQSFQPELLQFMHRVHSRKEALKSLELLGQAGFNSFTVDLIYGNPGQSTRQLLDDAELFMQYKPPHISAYSLTVEPNTRLGKQVELNRVIPAEDSEVADHFNALNHFLNQHGIYRYEVSNYSKAGKEAVHNSNYWKHENYLGLGPAAHSFWWQDRDKISSGWKNSAERWHNEESLRNYPAKTEPEQLNLYQLAEERLMMGLRTREGIKIQELNSRYVYELNDRQVQYLKQKEEEDKVIFDSSIQLTEAGIIIADAIILDLLTL